MTAPLGKNITIKPRTREALGEMNKLNDEAMMTLADLHVQEMVKVVPVQFGFLKRSLAFEKLGIRVYRTFTATGYGAYVALGTARMAPRDFFTSGWKAANKRFEELGGWE